MRISDWSSDVCSSDLDPRELAGEQQFGVDRRQPVYAPGQVRQHLAAALERRLHLPHWPLPFPFRVPQASQNCDAHPLHDRKSVVAGKSVSVRVDLGGRRIIKKKTITKIESIKI